MRSNPPLRLSRTPLIYVVTQIRFSAIVSIEKYVPEVQEKLRHKYPWFQHSKIQEFTLQAQAASTSTNDRYEFLQRDKRTGVVLTSNSLALHTNKYSNYEVFIAEFSQALASIDESIDIGPIERIGLRYVDLVRLGENESWADYFAEGLLGLEPSSVGVTQWNARQFACVGKTNVGTLMVRLMQSDHPLPPDLTPPTLQYETELLRTNEVGTILDFDHFSEQMRDFELEPVITAIGDLHDNVDRAFRNAVTPAALRKWE